jgi:hypothetical protein
MINQPINTKSSSNPQNVGKCQETSAKPDNTLRDSLGTVKGTAKSKAEDTIMDKTAPESLDGMQKELLEALDNDELLSAKGKKAIVRLIKSDESRATIRHTIKSSGLDKHQYIAALQSVLMHYSTSQQVIARAACEEAGGKWAERHVMPLLVELGIIVRVGDRSAHWQAWDKIGCTTTLLDKCKAALELTPAQRAAAAASDALYAERKKLETITKQEATMKQQAAALARIAAERDKLATLAAANPTNPTMWDKAKQHPAAVALVAVLLAGLVFSKSKTIDDTPLPAFQAQIAADGGDVEVSAEQAALIKKMMLEGE